MVNYYDDGGADTSPEGRQRVLAEIAAGRRLRAQETLAVPVLTGDGLADLAAAIDAAQAMEIEWEAADSEFRAARAQASPFGDVRAWEEAGRLEQTRDRCWSLFEQACANRDRLQAREDELRDPGAGLMPDGEWR